MLPVKVNGNLQESGYYFCNLYMTESVNVGKSKNNSVIGTFILLHWCGESGPMRYFQYFVHFIFGHI